MFQLQKAFRLALGASCLLALSGCIERKITLGSDPSGALATVNDEEIGRTPITFPFLWNGDYDIILRLDKNVGTPDKPDIRHYYLHTHRKTKIPPFEWFGVDFFAAIVPWTYTHEEVWAFEIPLVQKIPDDILILRAKSLKSELETPEQLQQDQKRGK